MPTWSQNPHLICFAAYSGPSCTPQPHILAAFLLPGRLESSRGASKEEGPEGSGLRATLVVGGATAAEASVLLGALLRGVL